MASRQSLSRPSVHTELRSLGLRSYNDTNGAVLNRAIYKHPAVKRLYREELPSLFRILVRGEGSILDRNDPVLFDKELDNILREYGPLIWPSPSEGSRDHLLTARIGTPYESDLIYPRDTATLKNRLRRNILAKKTSSGVDYEAQMEKKAGGSALPDLTRTTPMRRSITRRDNGSQSLTKELAMRRTTIDHHASSEDLTIGTTTRQPANTEGFPNVQLRLYRKTKLTLPCSIGPIAAYEPMSLTSDCTTSYKLFNRICEQIAADCSYAVFQFPEDVSQAGTVRLNRGSSDSEAIFKRVLDLFRNAKKFPSNPQYRSVEVEIGLDLDDISQITVPALPYDDSSSSLSSVPPSPNSPRVESTFLGIHASTRPAERERPGATSTTPRSLECDCFSSLHNGRGHYNSARNLLSRGIWIGYLSPEKQKKSYCGLPSFKQLRANFHNMTLPFPPSTLSTSNSNREAVCQGCFGKQTALITLREMAFVQHRSLIIMPLDGEDEMGMFCILLPQPMDRAMKNLQTWRLYEVNNGGDGTKFENSFALLTLRCSSFGVGTIEMIGATLRSTGTSHLVSQPRKTASTVRAPMGFLSTHADHEEDDSDEPLPSHRACAAQKRKSRTSTTRKPAASKRKRTETGVLRLMVGKDALHSVEKPLAAAEEPQAVDALHSEEQPPLGMTNEPQAVDALRSEEQPPLGMANEPQAVDALHLQEQPPSVMTNEPHAFDALYSEKQPPSIITNAPQAVDALHLEEQPPSVMTNEPQAVNLQVLIGDAPLLVANEVQAAKPLNFTQKQPSVVAEVVIAQHTPAAIETQASSGQQTPSMMATGGLTDEQAGKIIIVWTVDVDGEECDFPLAMSECTSFGETLDMLRKMTASLPAVAAIIEKTTMWRLMYMLPNGQRKRQMALKGTEWAFDCMRMDLSQHSLGVGVTLKVELRAV